MEEHLELYGNRNFSNLIFVRFRLACNFDLLRVSVDKKTQIDGTFCILYFSSNSCSACLGQSCAHHQELTTA